MGMRNRRESDASPSSRTKIAKLQRQNSRKSLGGDVDRVHCKDERQRIRQEWCEKLGLRDLTRECGAANLTSGRSVYDTFAKMVEWLLAENQKDLGSTREESLS